MTARFGRGTGPDGFEPPESFPNDVVRYHGVAPERPCDKAPPSERLFYSDMDDETIQSYLTWRAALDDGREVEPYYAFVWLRVCEIVNDPLMSEADALDEALMMNKRFSSDYTLSVLTANAAKDLCLVMGRRWPAQILWTGGYLKDAALAEAVTGDPVPDIPFGVISRVCGMDVLKNVTDRDGFADMFSESLRAIISLERTSDPHLFGPECFTERKVRLFEGTSSSSKPQYASVKVMRLDGPGRWKDIFRGLAATVYSTMYWERQDIPWREALLLTDEQAERVRISMERDDGERDSREDSVDWVPGDQEDEGFPLNPTVLEDMRAKMTHPRKDSLRASIRIHNGLAGRKDAPFVPSGHWCASYEEMGHDQLEFYLSWRSEVLAGNYRDTDRGYLWLLLNELVDSENDPVRRMSILNGLLKAYGQSSDAVKSMILRTCQDYAIVTGQDPPWDGTDRDQQLLLWIKLDIVPMGRIPVSMAAPFTDVDVDKYCTGGADYDAAFAIALRALEAKVYKRTGMSLAETLTGRSRTVYRKLFPGLSTDWGSCSLTVCDIRPTNSGGKMLAFALRTAIRCVNTRLKLRCPRIPAGSDPEYLSAMETEVSKWLDRQERARRIEMVRREAATIVLDRGAVADAETDLAAVRDMVGTEEEPESVPDPLPEAPVAETASEGPWADLARTLDEVQRGYLSASLEGNGESFARTRGSTTVRLEDGINAAAMDTVGDQIIEDGEVFEEYADDVRRIVGEIPAETGRSPRSGDSDDRDTQEDTGHYDERAVLRCGPPQGTGIYSGREKERDRDLRQRPRGHRRGRRSVQIHLGEVRQRQELHDPDDPQLRHGQGIRGHGRGPRHKPQAHGEQEGGPQHVPRAGPQHGSEVASRRRGHGADPPEVDRQRPREDGGRARRRHE